MDRIGCCQGGCRHIVMAHREGEGSGETGDNGKCAITHTRARARTRTGPGGGGDRRYIAIDTCILLTYAVSWCCREVGPDAVTLPGTLPGQDRGDSTMARFGMTVEQQEDRALAIGSDLTRMALEIYRREGKTMNPGAGWVENIDHAMAVALARCLGMCAGNMADVAKRAANML